MRLTREQMREAAGDILRLLDIDAALPAGRFLDNARQAIQAEQWDQVLELCALAVQQEVYAEDTASRAAGLACRALLELWNGDVGEAASCYRRAGHLFRLVGQPGNESAAMQGEAYVWMVLGNVARAYSAYDGARKLLLRAANHEADERRQESALRYYRRAARVRRYMENLLLEGVVQAEMPQGALLVAPVRLLADPQAPKDVTFSARELMLGDTPYRLHAVPGGESTLALDAQASFSAVAVPPEGWPELQAERGDYALLRNGEPLDESGWTIWLGESNELILQYHTPSLLQPAVDRPFKDYEDAPEGGPVWFGEEANRAEGGAGSGEGKPFHFQALLGYVVGILRPLKP